MSRTCRRTRAATRPPAPVGPRRRRRPVAVRFAPRASAGRPASPCSSAARCSGSTPRPVTASRQPALLEPRRERSHGSSPRASATRSGSRSVRGRTSSGSATSAGPTWEEIDRIVDPLAATTPNVGWPCYEGNGPESGVPEPRHVHQPLRHADRPADAVLHLQPRVEGRGRRDVPVGQLLDRRPGVLPGRHLPGVLRRTALFFADHSRNCIWAMRPGANGLPDTAQIETFVVGRRRTRSTSRSGRTATCSTSTSKAARSTGSRTPRATRPRPRSSTATPASGPSPLLVDVRRDRLDRPRGRPLTYAWDLDDDGQYDDSTASNPTVTFTTPGTHTVRLRVTDAGLATGTASRSHPGRRRPAHAGDRHPDGGADVAGRRHHHLHGPRDRRPGRAPCPRAGSRGRWSSSTARRTAIRTRSSPGRGSRAARSRRRTTTTRPTSS